MIDLNLKKYDDLSGDIEEFEAEPLSLELSQDSVPNFSNSEVINIKLIFKFIPSQFLNFFLIIRFQ